MAYKQQEYIAVVRTGLPSKYATEWSDIIIYLNYQAYAKTVRLVETRFTPTPMDGDIGRA